MAGPISAGMMATMRKAAERAFDQTATLYRMVEVTNEQGRPTKQYPAVLKDVRCSVGMAKSQRVGDVGERRMQENERSVCFAVGTDVRAGDVLRTSGGSILEVIGTDADRSDTTFLTASCIFDTMNRGGLLG